MKICFGMLRLDSLSRSPWGSPRRSCLPCPMFAAACSPSSCRWDHKKRVLLIASTALGKTILSGTVRFRLPPEWRRSMIMRRLRLPSFLCFEDERESTDRALLEVVLDFLRGELDAEPFFHQPVHLDLCLVRGFHKALIVCQYLLTRFTSISSFSKSVRTWRPRAISEVNSHESRPSPWSSLNSPKKPFPLLQDVRFQGMLTRNSLLPPKPVDVLPRTVPQSRRISSGG